MADIGRPSKYDPNMCQKVLEWGAEGKSKTQMAAKLGVSKQRLYDWERDHDEFRDALTRAMTLSQAWWEDKGQEGMTADKFNGSVWSRSMAARFPEDWRENKAIELTTNTPPLTPEARDAEIKRLLAKRDQSPAYVAAMGTEG